MIVVGEFFDLPMDSTSTFVKRAGKHINEFIRVYIKLDDEAEFPLLVDRNLKMEYIAKQIEAEVAARSISRNHMYNAEQSFSLSLADVVMADGDGFANTVDILQIYDSCNLAIPFSSNIGDVASFDDVLIAISSRKGIID